MSIVVALAVAATAQTYTLPLGTTSNWFTAVGGATTFEVVANTPVTWTDLEFQIGPGTPAGANASVSIWICSFGEVEARRGYTSTLVGTTVPVVATGAASQTVLAPIVPAAPFASLTLPSIYHFGITLVAHNCSLRTTSGTLSSITGQMTASGGAQFSTPPGPGTPPPMQDQRHLAGSIRYVVGGTPINLGEMLTFGVGCGGLALSPSGAVGLGQTVTLTTTPGVATPSVGVCFLSLDTLLGHGPGGIDLVFLGMPGCGLLADFANGFMATIANHPSVPAGLSFSFAVPSSLVFSGWTVWAQSAWMQPGLNPLGMSVSNGVRLRLW
ncbi:MAG: hypothetical protein JNK15_14190 [Planctomycetes bacterium]|nr:hypothetical protein [Planctomycetota bacterium]